MRITHFRCRTGKASRDSARRRFQVRLAWQWPAKACTPHRRLALPHTTTSEVKAQTRATNYTLATCGPLLLYQNMCIDDIFQLPYQAGWQDLKDLFRSAGNIVRADINIGADGRPKGSGTVIFETAKDAAQAIGAY